MDAAPPESRPAALRGLTEPLLRYLEARGVLLTIEAQEALQQIMKLMVFAGLVACAAFMAWVLFTGALLSLLVTAMHGHWGRAALILGVLHVVLALVFLRVVRNRLSGLRFFSDTLNEFKKDRAWLASQTHKP